MPARSPRCRWKRRSVTSVARRSIATTEAKGAGGIGIVSLHHVQVAMPEGGEAAARGFYGEVLGLTEVPKPDVLRGRGGVWFEAGASRVHLGVETPFVPARKAHPAFAVASLKLAVRRLTASGIETIYEIDLPDLSRVYISDPFGNRIEICEPPAR